MMEMLAPAEQQLARNFITRLGKTGQEIMSKECKGSVKDVFPGQWKDKTLKEILDASKSGDKTAKTAWKLLNDLRFKK